MKTFLQKVRDKDPNAFDYFIFAIIILSSIILGFETNKFLVDEYRFYFHWADVIILAIFTLEIFIKILSQGTKPWRYFFDAWNIFDLTIVLLSFLPYLLTHGQEDTRAFAALRLLRLTRALRVFRVFRLITHLKPLQILIETLIRSIPSMGYVVFLLAILFYIYGVLGVFIFGAVDPANFYDIPNAMLALFVCATGGWVELMKGLMRAVNDIGGIELFFVPFYFISFYFLAGMIVLNLFIGVIIQNLNEAHNERVKEDIRESFEDNLDKEAFKQMMSIEKQINELNHSFLKLQLALDKEKGKK